MKGPRLLALLRNPGLLTVAELRVLCDLVEAERNGEALTAHQNWLARCQLMDDGIAMRLGPGIVLTAEGRGLAGKLEALAQRHLGRPA